ncbi:MAG: C39 family peptidase [Myxococcaceae bacterium]|nr:C39 family peptidase [Myxococcaceae bacterium]
MNQVRALTAVVACVLGLGCGPQPEGGADRAVLGQGLGGAAPAKNTSFSWQGQQTGYWCGPASTRIALSAHMSPPSQQTLANFEGTTTNGTDTIAYIRNAMNTYLGVNFYVTHAISDPPSQAQIDQLKQTLVASVSNGYGMVGNIISGWRPPGYPGGTIYHYIAIVGYDQDGDRALIADPAGGCAVWCSVPQTYWVTTHDLAVWIGGSTGYTGVNLPIKADAPPNAAPRGSLDVADRNGVGGWSQDPDAPGVGIDAHVYFGGPAGAQGAVGVALHANRDRSDLCGPLGSCNHAFTMSAPRSLCDGAAHEVHAYGIDTAGGANPELGGSPKTLTCTVTVAGVKRHVVDPASFGAWGLSAFQDVAKVADAALDALPEAQTWPATPELVRGDGRPEVYLLDNGFKRHVTSPDSAAAWHLDLGKVKLVSAADIDALPTAAPLSAVPEAAVGSGPAVWVVDAPLPSLSGPVIPIPTLTRVEPTVNLAPTTAPGIPGTDFGGGGGFTQGPTVGSPSQGGASDPMNAAGGCSALGGAGVLPMLALALLRRAKR